MSDWWNRPAEPAPAAGADGTEEQAGVVCPWCSARPEPGATHCPGCGAALAQRDKLGEMVIPGVTDVDPEMRPPSYTGSMIRSQATVSTLNMVGRFGGTSAQMAVAAGMMAKDSLSGVFQVPENAEDLGKPSQAALDMAARLSGGEAALPGPDRPGQDEPADPSFPAPTDGTPEDEAQGRGPDNRTPR
jgi:hypothetical protein